MWYVNPQQFNLAESCASVALVVQERRHLGDGKNIQVAELR